MRNYTITSVWGIPIRLNISLLVFLPVLAWILGSGTQIATYAGIIEAFAPGPLDPTVLGAGSTPWVIGVTAAVALFVSVALHELGHAWAAMRYGLGVESITLWILGGIASLSEMPREWDREFYIALAGPAVSVALGIGGLVALQVVPPGQQVVVFLVGWIAVTNLTLTAFNLLPAFPMDGGRVFRALLARSGRRSHEDATRVAARVGTGFAVLFAVVGVLSFAPMLLLLALFVYGAAASESRTVALRAVLAELTVGDVATRGVEPVDADESVAAFSERMFRDRRTVYPVTDGGRVVGVVRLEDVRDVPEADRTTTTVGAIVDESAPRVESTTDAFDGFVELGGAPGGVALVTDGGEVVGTVSGADYATVMQYRTARDRAGARGAF